MQVDWWTIPLAYILGMATLGGVLAFDRWVRGPWA